jgi:hypothetical protein
MPYLLSLLLLQLGKLGLASIDRLQMRLQDLLPSLAAPPLVHVRHLVVSSSYSVQKGIPNSHTPWGLGD